MTLEASFNSGSEVSHAL